MSGELSRRSVLGNTLAAGGEIGLPGGKGVFQLAALDLHALAAGNDGISEKIGKRGGVGRGTGGLWLNLLGGGGTDGERAEKGQRVNVIHNFAANHNLTTRTLLMSESF